MLSMAGGGGALRGSRFCCEDFKTVGTCWKIISVKIKSGSLLLACQEKEEKNAFYNTPRHKLSNGLDTVPPDIHLTCFKKKGGMTSSASSPEGQAPGGGEASGNCCGCSA